MSPNKPAFISGTLSIHATHEQAFVHENALTCDFNVLSEPLCGSFVQYETILNYERIKCHDSAHSALHSIRSMHVGVSLYY